LPIAAITFIASFILFSPNLVKEISLTSFSQSPISYNGIGVTEAGRMMKS
jgi:hypothetical protein